MPWAPATSPGHGDQVSTGTSWSESLLCPFALPSAQDSPQGAAVDSDQQGARHCPMDRVTRAQGALEKGSWQREGPSVENLVPDPLVSPKGPKAPAWIGNSW